MSNLVIIKPIERKRCLGDGGEKYFKRPLYIEALKDENGAYNVGLTKKEIDDLQPSFPYSLDPVFKEDDMKSIWNREEGKFIMTYQTHVLDIDKPLDRIKYGLCKASPFVANSQEEYDEKKWPYAKFVITNSKEEEVAKMKRNEIKMKVYMAVNKMDTKTKRDFCMILGFNCKGMSDDAVSNKVFDAIETKGYSKAYEVIGQSKEYNTLNALLAEAVDRHILTKKGEVYSFMDETIGVSTNSAIEYLKDPKNNATKVAIINMLNE